MYMYASYKSNSEWKSKILQINTVYRTTIIISMFSTIIKPEFKTLIMPS